jgi:hypothetical protein
VVGADVILVQVGACFVAQHARVRLDHLEDDRFIVKDLVGGQGRGGSLSTRKKKSEKKSRHISTRCKITKIVGVQNPRKASTTFVPTYFPLTWLQVPSSWMGVSLVGAVVITCSDHEEMVRAKGSKPERGR